ncbi:FecR domain-containing protein, partial [Pseudorhizobium flavum]|uniref:FecR domain-containing protein n=1 Tax=Pseudorhizobium flavum TaxID=1335061 RepID=UPI000987BC9E
MPQLDRFLPFVAILLLLLLPQAAYAADWTVAQTTRQVSYTVDKQTWTAVEGGATIPNKAWISTGPRGRVTLERGPERVSFGPETLAAIITTNGFFTRKTDVVQQKGQLALDIEKRSRPHTYVHTPFLAAVVKGTSFQVTVTAKAASVSVDRGLVQVSSFTSGQSTDLGPGQQATVDQAQQMSVSGTNGAQAPAVEAVEPTRAEIAPVGQAAPIGADVTGSRSERTSNDSFSQTSSSAASGSFDSSGNGTVGDNRYSNAGANGNGNAGGNGNGAGNGNGNASGNGNGAGN